MSEDLPYILVTSRQNITPLQNTLSGYFPDFQFVLLVVSSYYCQDMRSDLGRKVSAPSATLLRFLKFQSESTSISCSGIHSSHNASSRPLFHLRPDLKRLFSTYQQRQATVEASLLNLDFLRKGPHSDAVQPADSRRPGVVFFTSHDRYDRSRPASTDSRSSIKQFWQGKRRKADWRGPDSAPSTGFLDDGAGTTLGRNKGKISNELKLRCTEFNEDGKVILVNGEFKKSELIAKVPNCLQHISDYANIRSSTACSLVISERSTPPFSRTF